MAKHPDPVDLGDGKIEVLEIDQFARRSDVEAHSLEEFKTGDVFGPSGRRLGFMKPRIVRVGLDDRPFIGLVWYRAEGGRLKLWRANYDSSG